MQKAVPLQTDRRYLVPNIFAESPELLAVQSLRHGGVSQKPFDSLNLGLSSGDQQECVLHNREIFYTALGG